MNVSSGSHWFRSTVSAADSLYLVPTPVSTPWYHTPSERLVPFMTDKYFSVLGPVVLYWLASAWFAFLDYIQLPFFEQYRLHEPEEVTSRNRVGPWKVAAMVMLQHAIQVGLGAMVLDGSQSAIENARDHQEGMRDIAAYVSSAALGLLGNSNGLSFLKVAGPSTVHFIYWWGIPVVQFWWAFFVMDAWQYGLHRLFHESRFLYRHFHSHHHRLYVPYAYGALYNHPLEGLLLDSAGAALAHAAALMTIRQGVVLFMFSTFKTVCDHGGYAFPPWLDPLHLLFPNCAEYHDVHHQMQGLKYNYSQPFFVHFDTVFGTRISKEKFDKLKALGKEKKGTWGKDAKAASGSSTALKDPHAAEDLRRRRGEKNDGQHDLPPEEAVQIGGDPLVTTNAVEYAAKAGTTVS
ncbi:Sphingolipid hydroxylase [Ceraceosorus bombacis]|uniref:Sphingolipid hydroxylase n=1 Tax=Ceraceosorus bombacis TaxID=401625 RepID=A0A0P1BNB3_9BASI|nr:Sphingolipid hydroxylase [Ceraceosorus bombacis]